MAALVKSDVPGLPDVSSSFGDIYPYIFWQGGIIYFRFDFGQVFIALVIGLFSSGVIFLNQFFRMMYDFQNLMDYAVKCLKFSMHIFCTAMFPVLFNYLSKSNT